MEHLMDYIRRDELERRWARVRQFMDTDALIVLQNVDQFYLSGTSQNGVLWFPREGEPIFAVRKSFERAKTESAVKNIVPMKSYSELRALIPNPGSTLGFELDVVPVATYQQVAKQFPNSKLVDGVRPFREARAVKTPYEVDCIRRAAAMLDKAFLDIPSQLHEGLAEFELSARIEYVMRMAEHQGLSRVRRFNMELFYGAVSFGETASYPDNFDGPVGARGLYPAVQAMGSRRTLKRGDPVMVDAVGGYAGYIAVGSRRYSLGPVSQQMRDTHQSILDLNNWIETQLRPGAIPSEIYAQIQTRVAGAPLRFVAHGVGLELDETPVIAPKFDAPLEAGVVLAVGGAGVENTYAITEKGCERLTTCAQEIHEV